VRHLVEQFRWIGGPGVLIGIGDAIEGRAELLALLLVLLLVLVLVLVLGLRHAA
jgi:hypothetical protein